MKKVRIEDSARIYGKVRLGQGTYIAQGTILRSEEDSILIENNSFLLENSVLIGTKENPIKVGQKTVFGHKCVAIGTEIGNLCEIGNGTIFLPGSKVGDRCIFGEGTIVPENSIIPDDSVVIGRPGRILRKLTDSDLKMIKSMRSNNLTLEEYRENLIDSGRYEEMERLHKYKDKYPKLGEGTKLYGTAEITGDVTIGKNCHIASGVKIIGDSHGPIEIGDNVHILENTVLHLLPDNKLVIKDNVVIGPNSIIHGTIIGKDSIIEAGAILCDNSKIGENTLVKAGTLIPQRKEFQGNSILSGFPAKIIGENKDILERPDWIIK